MAVNTRPAWFTVSWALALIALVLTIVFAAIGKLDYTTAGLFVLVELALLLP